MRAGMMRLNLKPAAVFSLIACAAAPVLAQAPLTPAAPPSSSPVPSWWVEPPPRSHPAAEQSPAAPEQPAPTPQVQGPVSPPIVGHRYAYRRYPAARNRMAHRFSRRGISGMRYGAMTAYNPHSFGPSPNRSSGN